jgi:electron-transferring-flavoprotein dehydrogenase
LSRQPGQVLIRHFKLAEGRSPQTYGIGIKELWQPPRGRVEPGPDPARLAGRRISAPAGSFLYHLDQNRIYVGYVAGLDYEDPRFRPFEAFQQFKQHPSLRPMFDGGELLSYGARTIVEGGWQSLPRLDMPGAMLIGDAGGLVNVPKIKGVHQAIRCGALAAEHLLEKSTSEGFDQRWRGSDGARELYKVRNMRPGFRGGLWSGSRPMAR